MSLSASSGEAPVLSKPHPSHPLLQAGQQVTAQCSIQGVATSLIITSFVDRIFICATQINKIGSLTQATTTVAPAAAPSDAPTYTVSTLLGVRNAPLPQLLARRIIESLSSSKLEHMARKPLLLSLGLKKKAKQQQAAASSADDGLPIISDDELQTVRELVAEIDKIKMW